jgi:phosphate transport system substrate-binding protein
MKNYFSSGCSAPLVFRFARTIVLASAAFMLAGCPANKQASAPAPTPSASGKTIIRGSNTIGEELAPRLVTEFKKDHANADFELETKATGYGLAALRAGQCDIAAASRPATKEEVDEATRMGVVLNDYPIGSYSVAVVVHPNNSVANLTREQVRDIFTGTVTNWKDVGGSDLPIHLYVRDPISGTYLGFKELAMENKAYADSRKLATNYTDIVSQVSKDEGGIGYAGIGAMKDSSVKWVSIGGVEPTAASVNGGKYPYSRPLHLYTRKDNELPTTKDFIQFVQSAHGQEILAQMGFVPHP